MKEYAISRRRRNCTQHYPATPRHGSEIQTSNSWQLYFLCSQSRPIHTWEDLLKGRIESTHSAECSFVDESENIWCCRPPPADANPTLARSNSLAFWKKAISFFMPNRLIPWVSGRNKGNPTRSIEINNLIKRVKKKEVWKQGVASQCRRGITEDEFWKM